MKKYKILNFFFVAALLLSAGCESIDLNQTENPSTPNAQLLDPIYTFNYVQLKLPEFFDATNSFTQEVTRQMAMTGGNTYDNAYAPVNFNTQWSLGFDILNAVKTMEPKATEINSTYILGASKVIRCYVLMTFVDMYGRIPYTESLQGVSNITPRYDDDALVYESIINELDEAIATLNTPTNPLVEVQDLYYKSAANWVTLANTLKLKMYNNCNMLSTVGSKNVATEINSIIAQDDYIDVIEEDFTFKYGNTRFNPNSRHPLYNDQYELGGGAYIGNYFMWVVTLEKGSTTDFQNTITDPGDPRTNYYFLRQDANPNNDDTFTLPGRTRPEHYNNLKYNSFFDPTIRTPYSVSNWSGEPNIPENGFWGRDHGNNTGIPPDAEKRTVAGYYPIGGEYGPAAKVVQTNGQAGQKGAGIMPIMLSSFVHYIKAELMLKGIISGDPKAELTTAISQSIEKVTTLFPNSGKGLAPAVLASKTTKYLNFIGSVYDEANDARRLELIIKEYYIATWGNGIEPYNNYRRTAYPSNFQPTLEPESGQFYNAAFYAGSAINNNPNVPVNDRTRKVFWAVPNTEILN